MDGDLSKSAHGGALRGSDLGGALAAGFFGGFRV